MNSLVCLFLLFLVSIRVDTVNAVNAVNTINDNNTVNENNVYNEINGVIAVNRKKIYYI